MASTTADSCVMIPSRSTMWCAYSIKLYLNHVLCSLYQALGTYITSNLSDDTEVKYKQRDFINMSNSTIYKFGFATREVVMRLINS